MSEVVFMRIEFGKFRFGYFEKNVTKCLSTWLKDVSNKLMFVRWLEAFLLISGSNPKLKMQ